MKDITQTAYDAEIQAIAESLATEELEACDWDRDQAEESINNGGRLSETIDGHQWVIYTAYNLDVVRYSHNPDAYVDNFGTDDAGRIIKDRGIEGLHTIMAYFAMEQDVRDVLDDALDAAIEKREEKAV